MGWDESNTRKVRVVTAALGLALLISGTICQYWAGKDFGEIPLSTLCEAYSGERALMDDGDWRMGKNEYYLKNGDDAQPLTLQKIAEEFLAEPRFDYSDFSVEKVLYASPSFWCKYLPACPLGAICDGGKVVKSVNGTHGGAWKGRLISSKPAWGVPVNPYDRTTHRIRCEDKHMVYKSMIQSIFTDRDGDWVLDKNSEELWNAQALELASDQIERSCWLIKGSTGYILDLPPILATLTCLICLLTLCRWFQGPFTATAAESLAVISVALTLVSFWVVEMRTDEDFLQSYMYCGIDKVYTYPKTYMVVCLKAS